MPAECGGARRGDGCAAVARSSTLCCYTAWPSSPYITAQHLATSPSVLPSTRLQCCSRPGHPRQSTCPPCSALPCIRLLAARHASHRATAHIFLLAPAARCTCRPPTPLPPRHGSSLHASDRCTQQHRGPARRPPGQCHAVASGERAAAVQPAVLPLPPRVCHTHKAHRSHHHSPPPSSHIIPPHSFSPSLSLRAGMATS